MPVYDNSYTDTGLTVTKQQVLEIFARNPNFITPDQIYGDLRRRLDRRSVYSYLLRLKRQGLLETGANIRRGHLAYRMTGRGHARLKYFRSRQRQIPW
jgi:Fe2+ or Zn2+ uptake regulation protein